VLSLVNNRAYSKPYLLRCSSINLFIISFPLLFHRVLINGSILFVFKLILAAFTKPSFLRKKKMFNIYIFFKTENLNTAPIIHTVIFIHTVLCDTFFLLSFICVYQIILCCLLKYASQNRGTLLFDHGEYIIQQILVKSQACTGCQSVLRLAEESRS